MAGKRIGERIEYIKRYRTILKVLFKYGFGQLVEKLNIEHYFEYGKKIFYRNRVTTQKTKLKSSERLRMVFEELGPTFIKLGQILSSRPDLISVEYINELKKLQDKIEPLPFEIIQKSIEKSFDKEIDEIFSYIDPEPLGAASIAQVHRAILKSGEEVVVKVKKPDIEHMIETDTEILYDIARLIEKRAPELSFYNPVNMVNEFRKSIKRELDFTREGRNNDIVRLNFENIKNFRVPKIFWDYTNQNVLTMEMIKGQKMNSLIYAGYKNKEIAKLGVNIYLKQILEDGFFHADPHPGNIFLENDNTIVFIDYGMVGILDEKDQENMAEIIAGLAVKDMTKIINGFRGFNTFPDGINEKSLKSELKEILDKYYSLPVKQINIGKIFDEMSQVIIRYKVAIPADFFLIGKTIMTIEGIAKVLDPEFDIIEEIRPYTEKLILRKYSAKKILKNLMNDIRIYKSFFENIPEDLQEITKKIKENRFSFEVRSREISDFSRILDRVMNRITAAIIVAALIIASSNLIQSQTGIMVKGYSVLGITGFVIAGIFSIIILIDVIRKG